MKICIAPLRESTPLLSNASSLMDRADEDGYLFLRRLVPADVVYALRNVALEMARLLGWLDPEAPLAAAISVPGIALGSHDDPRWIRFSCGVLGHPAFLALKQESSLVRVLEQLFAGSTPSSAGDVLRVVSGDDPKHTTGPHQERHYVKGTGSLWIAWLPLGDCPISLGPLAIARGSHRAGLLQHRVADQAVLGVDVGDDLVWDASDLAAGDVLLFSGLTLHRALPHRSGRRLRLSADFRFQCETRQPCGA